MTAEIVLPAGTEYVPIEEIPSLIAQALIPDAAGEPPTISYFVKTARPGATGKASEWDGWPIDDDDRRTLEEIWADLPPIPDRATQEEARPYMEAFVHKGRNLDWELEICWNNPQLQAAVARRDAEREHLKAAIDAIRRAHLKVVSRHTRIPVNEYAMNAVVLVSDLIGYVERFQIAVRFSAPTNAELDEIYLQQDQARRAAGRYSLEDAAREIARHTGERVDQVERALVLGAEAGVLPVYRPGENLKYRPDTVRVFYEEAHADDLNEWLLQNEPRITWRFPLPTACSLESNGFATSPGNGLLKRERQIRAIETVADEQEIPRMQVPTGGKKNLRSICKQRHPDLFGAGDDPFDEAWQDAVDQKRLRMKDHAKFAAR